MLWVDKYRPNTLAKLDVHQDLQERLQSMSQDGEIPHLLFYGPSGAGKKTRVLALLREIFGPGADRVKLEHRTFKTPTNRVIELTTVASNYHIEMSPSDAGNFDRFVVQEVIKEIAGSQSLATSIGKGKDATDEGGESSGKKKPTFKVVLLTGVDNLSRQAQAALRRTMEKYTSQCRLILICNSASKVIEPVRSRCLGVRVPAPTVTEICTVLNFVARKEKFELPEALAKRIAMKSSRNLRRAILMLEATKVQAAPRALTMDSTVALSDWQSYIADLARSITSEQSPQVLIVARGKLYELLTNCIPADVILTTLARELTSFLADEGLKHDVAYWAAFYEHRLHLGSKDIFHLEAFIAKFMALYKAFIVALFC